MLQKELYPRALGPTVRRLVLLPAPVGEAIRTFFCQATVEIGRRLLNQKEKHRLILFCKKLHAFSARRMGFIPILQALATMVAPYYGRGGLYFSQGCFPDAEITLAGSPEHPENQGSVASGSVASHGFSR